MDSTSSTPQGLKCCTGCNQSFPATAEFFYAHKRNGLATRCKECTKEAIRAKYQPHPMTDEKEQTRRTKQAESLRTSERGRIARERLADARRSKPRKPFTNPEQHSANLSKALKGKKHNIKPRINFKYRQVEVNPIGLDLPVFDGCEPRDNTQIDEVMSIYAIINTVTSKLYVGSAIDTKHRWYIHRWHLQRGEHHSRYLQRAWDKHGANVFNFRLLEIVDDAAMLIPREQYWIDRYCSADYQYGYNLHPIAGSPLGVRHTSESRAHMKASKQGFTITPEIRAMGAEKRRQKTCKLTESDVRAIVERLAKGRSVVSIAQEYSISIQTVYNINKGKHWTLTIQSDNDI